LRDITMHLTSTNQYLASKNPIPSLKAAQLLRLLIRLCPSANMGLQKYLNAHVGGFADIDDYIRTVSASCNEAASAKSFLED
ncbi:hypothetical protein PMAYCL1PPCAC_22516, partial [Pristionchus mayeri]